MMKTKCNYLPLILAESYWILTYILYRFGGVKWPFGADNKTLFFLGACDLLFAAGYIFCTKFLNKRKELENPKKQVDVSKFIWICAIISAAIAIPNCIRFTGNWYPKLLTTLSNPGATYQKMISIISAGNNWNMLGILDFFHFVLFPLVFFAWDALKRSLKIVGCIVSFYYLVVYCCCGRNMPCMLFVFSVLITYITMICSEGIKNKKKLARNTAVCICSLLLLVVMFKLNLESRTLYSADVETALANMKDSTAKDPDTTFPIEGQENGPIVNNEENKDHDKKEEIEENIDENIEIYNSYKDLVITKAHADKSAQIAEIFPMYTSPYSKAFVDLDDFLYCHLPDSLKFVYVMGTQYAAGSYHALSVALRMDFQWSYGIGFSEFLMHYVERFTGIDVKSRTYGARLVNLTKPPIIDINGWTTAYVQLASDLSFPGVAILFFFIGMLFAWLWNDVRIMRDAFALPFLIQLSLFLMFVPLSCITFGSGGYFVSFFASALIWLISKYVMRRRNHG